MAGFSLIELLIALAILASTVVAITLVCLGSPFMLAAAAMHEAAFQKAEDMIDRASVLSESEFDLVNAVASTTEAGYTTSLSVMLLPDGYTKRLIAEVSWIDAQHNPRMLTISALITDPTHATDHFCFGSLSGDWTKSFAKYHVLMRSDLLPERFAIATSSIDALTSTDKVLVLGSNTLAHAGDPDIFLFGISDDPLKPQYRSSIGTSSTTAGIAAFTATRTYLYVASASACTVGANCGQLQIVDIRDASVPVLVGHLLLSTSTQAVAAKSIAYRNGFIYLGLTKTPSNVGATNKGPEFNIIDVHDPTHPIFRGGYSVGRTINTIVLQGPYAYLATDDRGHADVLVLDTHDPSHIAPVSSISLPPLLNTTSGFVHAEALGSGTVLVGRTVAASADEFSIFSTASSSLSKLFSRDLGTSVESILVRDTLAFLLTKRDLQIWNVENPVSPRLFRSPLPLAELGSLNMATSLTCSGNTLYVGSNDLHRTGTLGIISTP